MWQLCCFNNRVSVPVANSVGTITFLKIALYNDIVFSSFTLRNFVVWDIWNLTKQLSHFFLSCSHLLVKRLRALFELSYLLLNLFCFILFTFFHQATNLRGKLFLLAKAFVELLLSLTTFFVNI